MSDQPVCVILGASAKQTRPSNKAVRAYLKKGYRVIPVNHKVSEVEGIPTISTLDEITEPIDILCVYVNPGTAQRINLLLKIAALSPGITYFPPDQNFEDTINILNRSGINATQACSIVAAGHHPKEFTASPA